MIQSISYKNDKDINILIEALKTDGIVVLRDYFTKEQIEKFIEEFEKIFQKNKNLIEILDKEKVSKDERIFHAQKYSNFILNHYYNNAFFDNISSQYTRRKSSNKKTLINKIQFSEKEKRNSGAGWHRDNHDCQFKIIMYLTDVTEKNGNFQWITKSSKKHIGFPNPRTKSYNTRFSDEVVGEILTKEQCNLENVVGPAGTIIIADTTYIHRGNIIEEGYRYAITQYFF